MLKFHLTEHLELFKHVFEISNVSAAAEALVKTFKCQKKILICGNGGSAADAQHFAAELVGRFERDRESLPAIALTTDSSILTAVGNDYGYDAVFERQVRGLGRRGDVCIAISTSGNSPNVVLAVEAAKSKKMIAIGLLGKDGGILKNAVDIPIIVPHQATPRIQEVHQFILHYWAAYIECRLFDK